MITVEHRLPWSEYDEAFYTAVTSLIELKTELQWATCSGGGLHSGYIEFGDVYRLEHVPTGKFYVGKGRVGLCGMFSSFGYGMLIALGCHDYRLMCSCLKNVKLPQWEKSD